MSAILRRSAGAGKEKKSVYSILQRTVSCDQEVRGGNGTTAAIKKFKGDILMNNFSNNCELLKARENTSERSCGVPSKEVQAYMKALRKAGTPVSIQVVLAAKDRTLLQKNGGTIQLKRSWAMSLLRRMGYVRGRRYTECGVERVEIAALGDKRQEADHCHCGWHSSRGASTPPGHLRRED